MTFNPNVGRSGNTVTAQYNTTQAETPKQPTGKQEQVLKALESALPFFDASDYGLKADKGKADTPPVHTGGGKGNNSVKDFFKSIGKAISSGFEKIGDFFKSIGKAQTPSVKTDTPPTRYGDTLVAKPNLDRPQLNKAGGVIAFAYKSGGEEGLTKIIDVLAQKANTDFSRDVKGATFGEFMERNFALTSDLGHGLHGTVLNDIKEMIPELKVKFADNPAALSILDAVNNFSFEGSLQESFSHQVDGLTSISNPLGKFMRDANDFSLGMVALARSEGFDQNAVSNRILTPHMGEMASLQSELDTLPPEDRKKEDLTGAVATKMMDLTKSILNDSLKTDGPGSLIEAFGQDHIDRLNGFAQQIADRHDLPVDVRNQAIQTIYVDQLFLRNMMSGLASTTKSKSVEFTAVQIAQSILNGAGGGKFQTQDMRDAYANVAQDFHENFVQAMVKIGMPVVE